MDELSEKLNELRRKNDNTEKEVKKIKLCQEDDVSEREELLARLAKLKSRKAELLALVAQYKDSDPDVIAQEKKETEVS